MFHQFILPQMGKPRSDWDSESDFDEGVFVSEDECKAKCEERPDCRQYAFWDDGRCRTRGDPRLGKAVPGVRSGWLEDRMIQFEKEMAPCGNEGWLV